MKYPTIEEVNQADITKLCSWQRFLGSPGWRATGKDNFEEIQASEAVILDKILDRQDKLGGMTPAISKVIGWE